MSRIVLIDPWGRQKGLNAGCAYLAAGLKRAGHEPLVIDANNSDYSLDEMIRIIEDFNAHVVGFSIKTGTYKWSIEASLEIAKRLPHVHLIAGGPHVTLFYDEFLTDNRHFVAGFLGDCEDSLPAYINALEASGYQRPDESPGMAYVVETGNEPTVHACARGPSGDLDDLARPDFDCFHRVDFSRLHYPLLTSRGCPYTCTFCSVGKISGYNWRHRKPELVVEELMAAKDKWDIREFDVLDDTFTQGPKRVKKFAEILTAGGANIPWSCPNGIRADRWTPGLFEAMAYAGCHTITIGIESANPKTFALIQKSETLDHVEHAIQLAKQAGIRVGGYFIIGLPGDTYRDVEHSLEYSRRVGLDWAHFNMLTPYPKTAIWEQVVKRGRMLEDYKEGAHFAADLTPIFTLDDFPAEQIADAYRMVHTRQGLFHLLLPEDLSERRRTWAIRKLRWKYDRAHYLADITRDMRWWTDAALSTASLLRLETRKFLRVWARPGASWARPSANGHQGGGTSSEVRLGADISSAPQRVLMVNNNWGPVGGTERYMATVGEALTQRGHEVAVLCGSRTPWDDGAWEPSEVYTLPALAASTDPLRPHAVSHTEMRRILETARPDIIHIHNVHDPTPLEVAAEYAPTIRTVHDHNPVCPGFNKTFANGRICHKTMGLGCISHMALDGGCLCMGKHPAGLLNALARKDREDRAMSQLAAILVTTDYMRGQFLALGHPENVVRTLPLPTPIPLAPASLNGAGVGDIVWAGRMILPDKGLDVLLEALTYIRSEYRLVLAGDGPAKDYLHIKAQELGVADRVAFPGWLAGPRLAELYQQAHVAVLPSMWPEPFGLMGVEAMSYGVPVVAFDVGGVRQWLTDNETGFLVPRAHIPLLALRMEMLLNDHTLRTRMGTEARHSVGALFNLDRHLDAVTEIYAHAT